MGNITPTYNTQPIGGTNLNTSGVKNPVVPEFSAVAPEVEFGSTSFINDLKNDFNALKGAPIASAISIGLSGVSNVQNNSQINDASSYYDLYESLGNTQYSVGDINTLVTEKGAMQFEDAPSWETLYGRKKGDAAKSVLGGAGQGVLSGMAAGPWGALVGGLFGALTSGIGLARAKNAAKEEAAKIEAARQAAIEKNERNFQNAVRRTNELLDLQALANLSAFGGPLQTNGSNWTNGIISIGNGGTHEQNPIDGVPMGIGSNGKPNLVEEGELIYKNYVFSNRLKVPKKLRDKYKLGGELTYANAVKKIQKESEERPNDPISLRGLDSILSEFMVEQEMSKQKKTNKSKEYSHGGALGNIYDGLSMDNNLIQFYTPEEKLRNSLLESIGLNNPFTDYKIKKPFILMPQNEQTDYLKSLSTLSIPQLYDTRPFSEKWVDDNIKPIQPTFKTNTNNSVVTQDPLKYKVRPTNMVYAPVIGQGIAALTDLFGITNKPDYTNSDAIIDAIKQVMNAPKVAYTPTGTYLNYKPFDTLFYANQLAAQTNATKRAIRNNANGNRMTAIAGLLGADYNAQTQLSNLYRQAEEYNAEQKQKVTAFNNDVNQVNAEGLLKAAIANQTADAKAKALGLENLTNAYKMREATRHIADENKAANISGFLTSLGNVGHSNQALNARDFTLGSGTHGPIDESLLPLLYGTSFFGTRRKSANKSVRKTKKQGYNA